VNENVSRRARRVLVVGAVASDANVSLESLLAPDGLLIVMESDTARAEEIRRSLSRDGLSNRATVIGGDPRRMLYKLAGPFDVIVCDPAYISTRPTLERLLAPDGVIIPNVEP
jgi:predicted O-methyltransferase YrrM